MRQRRGILATIVLASVVALAGCGRDDAPGALAPDAGGSATGQAPTGTAHSAPTTTGAQATGPTQAAGSPITPTGSASLLNRRLTTAELERYRPNELGRIVVLEYHQFGPESEQFIRTPEQFRGDLQWLYDNDFHLVNLHDVLDFNIDVPAGKRPVVLTFDDSAVSQFRLIPLADGNLAVDPECAIGILEDFLARHPDFGRGGHFAVLPFQMFNWPGEYDQDLYARMKLRWLLDNGYELGNHTYEHVNMVELEDDEIMYQLAEANNAILALVPDAELRVITLPYGMFPPGGDDSLFRGFTYQGRRYKWDGSLLIGSNPTESPISKEYDPYWIARIQAYDEELARWQEIIADSPGILFVSDGNPRTVTVPNDLHPWLVDTLNESAVGNRELIRY
ncbi:MAG TPA: polysaccharide deacetylase family protein [Thermomicrobiales bacterium]|nr:polysaccharide deacetylase family protein [Thermomicrobiales bacterium]